MRTIIRKIGNSQGVLLPGVALKLANLELGDQLKIEIISGGREILLSYARPVTVHPGQQERIKERVDRYLPILRDWRL